MTNHTDLAACLQDFSEKLNANPRMRTLLKGWEPAVVVEATDRPTAYTMIFKDTRVAEIIDGQGSDAVHRVLLRAGESLLAEIFSGKGNPSMAFLDGRLEIFATDKDQIKLDAITLVMWGI